MSPWVWSVLSLVGALVSAAFAGIARGHSVMAKHQRECMNRTLQRRRARGVADGGRR